VKKKKGLNGDRTEGPFDKGLVKKF